ncbi:unnamed protein product [Rotaria sp. Silwood2]|nr:unnamed protein product [Rotaria sp. Silwood2]CAF2920869.1 unnamed protein product [Rotaria sp. Silwood2]CAF3190524.1 unnamed protein product [Rotaria sp. Silwood2]CAF3381468.1 unnamed protein product [Rotaria sp. Silwood2]CAF4049704.1 unnamed protein product [Rotaria sp. Silwood2]
MEFRGRSFDAVSGMRQAALVLNVQPAGNWAALMGSPISSGSHGQATVGISNIGTVMANWAIPEQFRERAVQSVRLLVLAATEETYSAHAFTFNIASGTSLTTLIVVITRISTPADPNLPVSVISTVLKAIDIPTNIVNEFVNAVIMDYNLPLKGSFMLGLTYSDDFAWEQIQYLYSPEMNGKYRSLTLFKNGDSVKNTASFFIIDIDADWNLAPDLLLITKSKSILGGLFSSSTQSIQEVSHVLTIDEAVKLQQFFMLVAIGNIAGTLYLNATIPPIN